MFTGLLNIEVDIRSRAVTVDAYGGQSITYSTIYSQRPSRQDTLSAEAQAILSRSGIMATHKFFCEGDLTIVAENEIVYAGTAYRVTNVIDTGAMSAVTHHVTVYTRNPS